MGGRVRDQRRDTTGEALAANGKVPSAQRGLSLLVPSQPPPKAMPSAKALPRAAALPAAWQGRRRSHFQAEDGRLDAVAPGLADAR